MLSRRFRPEQQSAENGQSDYAAPRRGTRVQRRSARFGAAREWLNYSSGCYLFNIVNVVHTLIFILPPRLGATPADLSMAPSRSLASISSGRRRSCDRRRFSVTRPLPSESIEENIASRWTADYRLHLGRGGIEGPGKQPHGRPQRRRSWAGAFIKPLMGSITLRAPAGRHAQSGCEPP
jgi:hypothetical protein